MVTFIVSLLIFAVLIGLLNYILQYIPGLPVWVRPVIVLIAVLFGLLWLLRGHVGLGS